MRSNIVFEALLAIKTVTIAVKYFQIKHIDVFGKSSPQTTFFN